MSEVKVELPKVVFILGCPGSGKGTQCSNIAREFGYVHLSAGDLLRNERQKAGSQYGDLINKHITEGSFVPVEITCNLIKMAMDNAPTSHFLIDGFPINRDNLDGWNREMERKVELVVVLYFFCPEKVCLERCLERGLQGSGRPDDNETTIKKRIQSFYEHSLPVINYYRSIGMVKTVDTNKPAAEVFNEIKKVFNNLKKNNQM